MNFTSGTDKSLLRKQLRTRRAGIDPQDRAAAARRAAGHLLRSIEVRRARHLAIYLAVGSELDTRPLIRALRRQGKRLSAPRIDPRCAGRMQMLPLLAGKTPRCNRYGIAEPPATRARHRVAIDVAIIPLVGFDRFGTRLGSGAGYYDRWLASLRPQPYRIGFAYSVQCVEKIPVETWDLPLDAVCTEAGLHRFNRARGERAWRTG